MIIHLNCNELVLKCLFELKFVLLIFKNLNLLTCSQFFFFIVVFFFCIICNLLFLFYLNHLDLITNFFNYLIIVIFLLYLLVYKSLCFLVNSKVSLKNKSSNFFIRFLELIHLLSHFFSVKRWIMRIIFCLMLLFLHFII